MAKQQPAQVYFSKTFYFQIKQIAKSENKALAQWIREVVEEKVEEKRKHMKKFSDLPTFDWDEAAPHTSENLDSIVYGLD